MLYCYSKSFCEPKPKDFEHSYQCCNSCNNKRCTNRCKDDCNTCGLLASQKWVKAEEKSRNRLDFGQKQMPVGGKSSTKKPKEKTSKKVSTVKQTVDPALAKKEARRLRRLARKSRLNKG